MESEHLQQQLAQLHAELADAPQIDPQVRELLVKVMADIAPLVERPPAQARVEPPEASSVADRLEAVAVQFEVGHPALATSVRRFLDMLVKAGL